MADRRSRAGRPATVAAPASGATPGAAATAPSPTVALPVSRCSHRTACRGSPGASLGCSDRHTDHGILLRHVSPSRSAYYSSDYDQHETGPFQRCLALSGRDGKRHAEHRSDRGVKGRRISVLSSRRSIYLKPRNGLCRVKKRADHQPCELRMLARGAIVYRSRREIRDQDAGERYEFRSHARFPFGLGPLIRRFSLNEHGSFLAATVRLIRSVFFSARGNPTHAALLQEMQPHAGPLPIAHHGPPWPLQRRTRFG